MTVAMYASVIVTNKVRVSILKHSKRQTKKRSQQIGDGD